jgi:hypothetical protein
MVGYAGVIHSDVWLRMYLRFVVADLDQDSERDLGIFHAVWKLRDEERLHSHEEELHDTLIEWFNRHLEKPTRFTASKPPFYRKQKRAISWFKDTAREHLARVRVLVAILEHHGVSVRMRKATRVGRRRKLFAATAAGH